MAKLTFNLHGYNFQNGLLSVRAAYEATIAALLAQEQAAVAEANRHLDAVTRGTEDAYRYDEHGNVLHAIEREFDLEVDRASEAVPIARNSYVLTLHHYWEIKCDEWMETERYEYKKAYDWLSARGLAIDRPSLEFLREACNTIKHNTNRLFKLRPYLFSSEPVSPFGTPDYARRLRLTDVHIDEMFKAVRLSGIQINGAFSPGFLPDSPLRTRDKTAAGGLRAYGSSCSR